MNRDLFIDKKHNEIFNQQGYFHIPNFLMKAELEMLKNIYQKKEKSFFDKGFHRTLDMKNLKKKTEICNAIDSIVTPISKRYLNNYRFFLTSFMTKEKSADEFDIHQNWSFVDEKKYTSLVIWIPLQNVDETNGCMYFITGSHRWEKGIRGNNIPWQYENSKEELLKQIIALPMKSGDAVFFDDATIHYTSANRTNHPRVSIAQVMIPNEAKPIFFNKDINKNCIEKYEIENDFYLYFTNEFLKGNLSKMKLVEVQKII